MAFRALMRGGIYLVFIVGVVLSWLIKRLSQRNASQSARHDTSPPDRDVTPSDAIPALEDANWQVRLAAVQALADMPATEGLEGLQRALDDTDPDVREAAATTLISHGDAAVSGVAAVLESGRPAARELAAHVLAEIGGSEALQSLARALHTDESAWVRVPAAEALGGTRDPEYIAALATALSDEHPDVYKAVVTALQQIGTPQARKALANHSRSSARDVDAIDPSA